MPEKKKLMTLCLPVRGDTVLLGMKKRGFGMGKWNGFGGKLEPGETLEEAAKRETFEECGIEVVDMEEAGMHEFRFTEKPNEVLEVHVYRVMQFSGEPEETEEMKPAWFVMSDIPFDTMWADDRYWFPLFFAKKKFHGQFLFDTKGNILEHTLHERE